MTLSPLQKQLLQLLIAGLGVFGLHLLLKDFGYAKLGQDLSSMGWNFLPVALTFFFPFTFLALSWWVLLEGRQNVPFFFLFLVSLVASAWNNIGPVAKSLGEPTRVLLLTDRISVRQAVRGMILFNISQAMGTLTTFGFCAAAAPFLFSLDRPALIATWLSVAVCFALNGLAVVWMLGRPGKPQRTRGRRFRATRHWLRWTAFQLRKYARARPGRYAYSVLLAALARFSEGLVFYAIFYALKSPLSVVDSIAVDVGRGIADNAFFFVPYQLGTREFSLLFVTESVLHKGQEAAIAASLVFRMGEITWIVAGFLLGLWMMRRKGKPVPAPALQS